MKLISQNFPQNLNCLFAFFSLAFGTNHVFAQTAPTPPASPPVPWVAMDVWALYLLLAVVFVTCLVVIKKIAEALAREKRWSLANALSEEVVLTAYPQMPPQIQGASDNTKTQPAEQGLPIMQGDKPLGVTVLVASTSRVIAVMGCVVILVLFIGFSAPIFYSFGQKGTVPDLQPLVYFFYAGLVLFAPYLVNKSASVFDRIFPKKS